MASSTGFSDRGVWKVPALFILARADALLCPGVRVARASEDATSIPATFLRVTVAV